MNLASKHYVAGIVWCILFGIFYYIIDGQIEPKVGVAAQGAASIEIPRSMNGHFYVAGAINGQAVTFMVDTGASTVAIGAKMAERLNLPRGRPTTLQTANGLARAEETQAGELSLGDIVVRDVRVMVMANLGTEALLGQNVLRHLEVIQTAEKMLLKAKPQ
jgi:aspartyl protease family protein